MSEQEQVSIREVQPAPARRANECPAGCKDKFGQPRIMKRIVNQSPGVKQLPGGGTKQVTYMVTKMVCDRCGEGTTSREEL